MYLCRLVEFLINTIPLRGLQDFLIRRHVHNCPHCEARLISRAEALLFLSGESDVHEDPDFSMAIKVRATRGTALEEPGHPLKKSLGRRAVSAAGLLIAAGAVLWFSWNRGGGPGRMEIEAEEKFRINYLKVDGVPADALVIQPRESDMVIIWVDRDFGSPNGNEEPGGRP